MSDYDELLKGAGALLAGALPAAGAHPSAGTLIDAALFGTCESKDALEKHLLGCMLCAGRWDAIVRDEHGDELTLLGYLQNELTPFDLERLKAHLVRCETCEATRRALLPFVLHRMADPDRFSDAAVRTKIRDTLADARAIAHAPTLGGDEIEALVFEPTEEGARRRLDCHVPAERKSSGVDATGRLVITLHFAEHPRLERMDRETPGPRIEIESVEVDLRVDEKQRFIRLPPATLARVTFQGKRVLRAEVQLSGTDPGEAVEIPADRLIVRVFLRGHPAP